METFRKKKEKEKWSRKKDLYSDFSKEKETQIESKLTNRKIRRL
jgi:hypothetical protein